MGNSPSQAEFHPPTLTPPRSVSATAGGGNQLVVPNSSTPQNQKQSSSHSAPTNQTLPLFDEKQPLKTEEDPVCQTTCSPPPKMAHFRLETVKNKDNKSPFSWTDHHQTQPHSVDSLLDLDPLSSIHTEDLSPSSLSPPIQQRHKLQSGQNRRIKASHHPLELVPLSSDSNGNASNAAAMMIQSGYEVRDDQDVLSHYDGPYEYEKDSLELECPHQHAKHPSLEEDSITSSSTISAPQSTVMSRNLDSPISPPPPPSTPPIITHTASSIVKEDVIGVSCNDVAVDVGSVQDGNLTPTNIVTTEVVIEESKGEEESKEEDEIKSCPPPEVEPSPSDNKPSENNAKDAETIVETETEVQSGDRDSPSSSGFISDLEMPSSLQNIQSPPSEKEVITSQPPPPPPPLPPSTSSSQETIEAAAAAVVEDEVIVGVVEVIENQAENTNCIKKEEEEKEEESNSLNPQQGLDVAVDTLTENLQNICLNPSADLKNEQVAKIDEDHCSALISTPPTPPSIIETQLATTEIPLQLTDTKPEVEEEMPMQHDDHHHVHQIRESEPTSLPPSMITQENENKNDMILPKLPLPKIALPPPPTPTAGEDDAQGEGIDLDQNQGNGKNTKGCGEGNKYISVVQISGCSLPLEDDTQTSHNKDNEPPTLEVEPPAVVEVKVKNAVEIQNDLQPPQGPIMKGLPLPLLAGKVVCTTLTRENVHGGPEGGTELFTQICLEDAPPSQFHNSNAQQKSEKQKLLESESLDEFESLEELAKAEIDNGEEYDNNVTLVPVNFGPSMDNNNKRLPGMRMPPRLFSGTGSGGGGPLVISCNEDKSTTFIPVSQLVYDTSNIPHISPKDENEPLSKPPPPPSPPLPKATTSFASMEHDKEISPNQSELNMQNKSSKANITDSQPETSSSSEKSINPQNKKPKKETYPRPFSTPSPIPPPPSQEETHKTFQKNGQNFGQSINIPSISTMMNTHHHNPHHGGVIFGKRLHQDIPPPSFTTTPSPTPGLFSHLNATYSKLEVGSGGSTMSTPSPPCRLNATYCMGASDDSAEISGMMPPSILDHSLPSLPTSNTFTIATHKASNANATSAKKSLPLQKKPHHHDATYCAGRISDNKEQISIFDHPFPTSMTSNNGNFSAKKSLQKKESQDAPRAGGYSPEMDVEILEINQKLKESIEEKMILIKERDQALEDLNNVESAFADVHRKYERSKGILQNLKDNENALIQREQELMQMIDNRERKLEMYKQKAQEKLELMYQDYEHKLKENETENTKLRAQIRLMEMKLSTMENDVEQKAKENSQLNALCNELISGQGNH